MDAFGKVDDLVAKPVLGSDGAKAWQDFAKRGSSQSSSALSGASNAPKAPLKRQDRAMGCTSWQDEKSKAGDSHSQQDKSSAGYTHFKQKQSSGAGADGLSKKQRKAILNRVRPSTMRILLLACLPALLHAFSPRLTTTTTTRTRSVVTPPSAASSSGAEKDTKTMEENLALLYEAAETKTVDATAVVQALLDLEKQQRALAKGDASVAAQLQQDLDGDWQLVFTTGTVEAQETFKGQINYFPIKAVQSFRTKNQDAAAPMGIQNGIYVGDWAVLNFSGPMEFDLKKRQVRFDFNEIALFNGMFNIPLGKGEAAQLGASSGLGSKSNVANAARNKKAFFNWISADDKVATARGAGGGLALWKRIG